LLEEEEDFLRRNFVAVLDHIVVVVAVSFMVWGIWCSWTVHDPAHRRRAPESFANGKIVGRSFLRFALLGDGPYFLPNEK
jgi:hypothetical protein